MPGDAGTNRRARFLLIAAAAVLFLTRLGAIGFWAPDEPRYGQIAEEMRSFEHGASGLVLLHLDGRPYTQKPPLYYWLAALAGAPEGRVTETAARLPSALAGVALVALMLGFGARLLGERTSLLGAALLMTSFEFAFLARRIQLDVLLALLETVALVAFWRLDRGEGRRGRNLLAMHGALGLAVLTKGPVGFLVPVLVMATWLAWERRLRTLRRAFPLWGLLLSIGPGVAWIAAAVALAPPGFFGKAVLQNLFGRFFAGTSHARPFYYYLYQFPADFLPWTLLAPAAVWTGWRRVFRRGPAPAATNASPPVALPATEADAQTRSAWRFLLAWLGASLVFFTLSSGKRGLYLLPAFPAAALLCADGTRRWLAERARLPRVVTLALAGLAIAFAGAGAAVAALDLLRAQPASAAFGGVVVAIVCVVAVLWPRLAWQRATLVLPVAAAFAIEFALFTIAFPALDPLKSPAPIARAAAALVRPGEPVGLLGDRGLIGGIVYYGHRHVIPLSGPRAVARFLESGGRVIVVRKNRLAQVEAVSPVTVRFRARSGRRTLLVVTASRASGSRVRAAPGSLRPHPSLAKLKPFQFPLPAEKGAPPWPRRQSFALATRPSRSRS